MEDERGSLAWGRTVEILRNLRGWKQGDLAKAAAISTSALSGYETGKLEPPDDLRARVEEALGVAGWADIAQGLLGRLLEAMEGGRVTPEVEGVLKKAATEAAWSTETALRAGLERVRRVRERRGT
jgi:transcriptional regulator with XRE-family HTH domain